MAHHHAEIITGHRHIDTVTVDLAAGGDGLPCGGHEPTEELFDGGGHLVGRHRVGRGPVVRGHCVAVPAGGALTTLTAGPSTVAAAAAGSATGLTGGGVALLGRS